ncbi:MAG: MerR family transcriptional regulator [Clostridiales bacterium]|nr:MerR family transcriptional regulator [Clostridiales bacterium]
MKVNDVARLTGVTVRTLHYYDQIGLLKPEKVRDTGYRSYTSKDLELLQQILFFRELDFPLNQIKEIMEHPNYDRREALKRQRELLHKKQLRLKKMVHLIDRMMDGDQEISFHEFDMTEIENMKQQYVEEAKKRWGETDTYKEYEKKTGGYSKETWNIINEEFEKILLEFSKIRKEDPACEKAQLLVREWQNFITKNYYDCTIEILEGLGMMYISDERFMKNMDCHGEGTAAFISEAIKIYCNR